MKLTDDVDLGVSHKVRHSPLTLPHPPIQSEMDRPNRRRDDSLFRSVRYPGSEEARCAVDEHERAGEQEAQD